MTEVFHKKTLSRLFPKSEVKRRKHNQKNKGETQINGCFVCPLGCGSKRKRIIFLKYIIVWHTKMYKKNTNRIPHLG